MLEPKLERGNRTLALPRLLAALRRQRLDAQIDQQVQAAELWRDSKLVFTTLKGTPLEPSHLTHAVKEWLALKICNRSCGTVPGAFLGDDQQGRGHVSEACRADSRGGPNKSGYLASYLDALRAAGRGHLRGHDLGHSAASILQALGLPPQATMGVLGHSSPHVTMGIYGHLLGSSRRQTADLMDAYVDQVDVQRQPTSALAPKCLDARLRRFPEWLL